LIRDRGAGGFTGRGENNLKPAALRPRINCGEGLTPMPADEAVIPLVQAGREPEAFERLVPEYRRRVFGLAFSILRDRSAAEDLAQEVFVKLRRALPRYDGRARLSTWIYAITRNAAVSALRTRRRTLSMSDRAVREEAEGIAAAPGPAGAERELRRSIEVNATR
jgi:RNA polymerase sigma-70 factor (ECF subfamily)